MKIPIRLQMRRPELSACQLYESDLFMGYMENICTQIAMLQGHFHQSTRNG